ncbi:dihydroorotate dehydrogenase electron transfer subunit [bacterium 210820-DFI.6.37]|nr:dihydroorotate dehydrogenase electron transfer subunit [bacterium 210820-DFI.6.37]
MEKQIYTILSNERLARDIYRMELEGDTRGITAPGQFINIKLEGFYLRRPISICDWDDTKLTIIYKTVGQGTEKMAKMGPGNRLDILCPLGNGYDLDKISDAPVIAGGGVGVPPMYGLTKALIEKGKKPMVVLGFNTKEEVFYEKEFRDLGAEVKVTTADGSYGIKGFVTDGFTAADYGCACGPEPMLKAVSDKVKHGQFSFEARMACGFGGCMGCSCETKYGYKRICKEGPVLEKEEIKW